MSIWIIFTFSIVYFGVILYISSFYKEFEERIKEPSYMKNVVINFILSVCIFVFIFYHTTLNTGMPLLKNIILTLLATDTIYYWFHHTSHFIPLIKKYMHSTHHNITNVLPLDTYYLDSLDYIIYSLLVIYLPLFFVENIAEYFILLCISMIHSIYIHSDIPGDFILPMFINSKYHTLHHTVGQGNYAIFFPFWDDYMQTRVKDLPIPAAAAASASGNHKKSMTREEFKEECVKGAKLTIIDGEVIDCASWIDIHPGGKAVIENIIGHDSTEDFNKMHGDSKSAMEMIRKLKIADISKEI